MTFTAVIHKEKQWYVAECPEVDTASQGPTIEEAVKNLQEATEVYLEEGEPAADLDYVRGGGQWLSCHVRQAGITVDEFVSAHRGI